MQKGSYWVGILGCGVAALAIGLGLGMNAVGQDAKPEPKPADKKPVPPQVLDVLENLDDLLKDLPDGIDKEQLKKLLEMRKEMFKNFPGGGFGGGGFPGGPGGFGFGGGFLPGGRGEGRLGVMARKPSETLVEQLDLPKNQGLVVEEVVKDSAADKAGLKAHDILLEVGGKAVPDDLMEFKKNLQDVKADAAVDVVVLRKGKKETIKGVKLPEAKVEKPGFGGFGGGLGGFPGGPGGNFQFQFQGPGGGFGGGFPGGGNQLMVQRSNDNFTIKSLEGGNALHVTGKVEDGKAKVSEVQVVEGGKATTYDSLDKVPDAQKEKVKSLLQMIEKGKIEQKNP